MTVGLAFGLAGLYGGRGCAGVCTYIAWLCLAFGLTVRLVCRKGCAGGSLYLYCVGMFGLWIDSQACMRERVCWGESVLILRGYVWPLA